VISVEFVTFVWRTATILFILSLAANSIHWERVQPFLRYAILRPIDAVRKMSGSGPKRDCLSWRIGRVAGVKLTLSNNCGISAVDPTRTCRTPMRVTNRRRPPRLCDGRYRAPGDAAAIRSGPRPSLCGRRATIRHVFVTGKQIVRDGKVLAFDYRDPSARLQMGSDARSRRCQVSIGPGAAPPRSRPRLSHRGEFRPSSD